MSGRWSWYCLCDSRAEGGTYDSEREAADAALKHWRKRHVRVGESNTYDAAYDIGPKITRPILPPLSLATWLGENSDVWEGSS